MSDASASEHPGKHSASDAACMGEVVHYSSHSNSAIHSAALCVSI